MLGHDDPGVQREAVLHACRGEGVREEIRNGWVEELDAPITGEGEESGRARAPHGGACGGGAVGEVGTRVRTCEGCAGWRVDVHASRG
jgi:hypothetical protein